MKRKQECDSQKPKVKKTAVTFVLFLKEFWTHLILSRWIAIIVPGNTQLCPKCCCFALHVRSQYADNSYACLVHTNFLHISCADYLGSTVQIRTRGVAILFGRMSHYDYFKFRYFHFNVVKVMCDTGCIHIALLSRQKYRHNSMLRKKLYLIISWGYFIFCPHQSFVLNSFQPSK